MRVTIVDSDVSYPPNSGKRLRTLNLMLQLARTHDITYIGRGSYPPAEDEAQSFLRDNRITPIIVPEPLHQRTGLAFYGRLAHNLIVDAPYSIYSHTTKQMRAAVQEHLRREPVDLCQIEYLAYLNCVDNFAGPKVLQAHNVEALLWKRYAETETAIAKRYFIRSQLRKFLRYEGEAFRSVTRVVCVSAADKQQAKELYGHAAVDVVDNGVDLDQFGAIERATNSQQILFLGALDWRPNLDAIGMLLNAIFPAVRQRVKQAQLAIVGRNASPSLIRQIANTEGVVLHADAADVKPHIGASAVMSVPLRIGGGSRLKILEALAAGLPVVSTSIGAEGLDLRHGVHLTIGDSSEEQAASLVAALTNPERARMQAISGQQRVRERYGWSMLADRLDKIWHDAATAARNN